MLPLLDMVKKALHPDEPIDVTVPGDRTRILEVPAVNMLPDALAFRAAILQETLISEQHLSQSKDVFLFIRQQLKQQ